MKIAVNVAWMRPGATGGMEHYVRNLIAAMAEADRPHSYVLITSPLNHATFESLPDGWERREYLGEDASPVSFRRIMPAEELEAPGVSDSDSDGGVGSGASRNGSESAGSDSGAATRATQTWNGDLADLLTDVGADLLFCPLMYALPLQDAIPTVVTIPDLQHESMPEHFDPYELASRSLGFESSTRRAAAVLAISQTVADEVVQRYGVDEDRVYAAPLGLNTDCDVPADDVERYAAGVLARYRIDYPFAFFPANAWPHKNHLALIRALRELADRGSDLQLVLTGSPFQYEEDVAPLVAELGLTDRVHHFGYVSREAIFGLYRASRMLVFPSQFEGFGLPLLEANRFGAPVACSDIPVLREVGGDAAEFFDPKDPTSIADALERVHSSEDRRSELAAAGHERLEIFNYDRTAEITLNVFDQIEQGELAQPAIRPTFAPVELESMVPEDGCRWYMHLPAPERLVAKVGFPYPEGGQPAATLAECLVSVDGLVVSTDVIGLGEYVDLEVQIPNTIDLSDRFHWIEVHSRFISEDPDVTGSPLSVNHFNVYDGHYGRCRVL